MNTNEINDKPDITLTHEEFIQTFHEATQLGKASAMERIKLLEDKLAELDTPLIVSFPEDDPATMQRFDAEVASVKGDLSNLESKVQTLETALTDVLAKTESIVEMIKRNESMVTIFADSARLSITNIDHCVPEIQKDHHVSMARQYLSRAINAYDRLRN